MSKGMHIELGQLEKRLAAIDNLVDIQCADGNWDASDYMRGLANGLLLAQAVLYDSYYEPFDATEEMNTAHRYALALRGRHNE